VTCGGGFIHRRRHCIFPDPTKPDINCVGSGLDMKECGMEPCPAITVGPDGKEYSGDGVCINCGRHDGNLTLKTHI